MKKQLMTTTALVAAGVIGMSGVALGAAKLTVGGNLSGIVSAASQDTKGYLGVDVFNDAEVHFKGSAKLDNGMKISTSVEMEAQTASVSVDESKMAISGPFGQIKIGGEDNAADAMVGGASGSGATNVGRNTGLHVVGSIIEPAGHAATASNTLDLGDGDSEKISYYTPRISGFQVGASYAPSFDTGNNKQTLETTKHHHAIAIGANYKGKMGGTAITIAAGYSAAENSDSTKSDMSGMAVAAAVTMGKITFAFGTGTEKNIGDGGITHADFGIKYAANKMDSFSLGYITASDAATKATAGDDKTTLAMLSYARVLGAGVNGNINLVYADYEGEVAGSSDDNDGFGIQTEIKVSF